MVGPPAVVVEPEGCSSAPTMVGFPSQRQALLVLVLAGAVVYLPAFNGQFMFDDYPWILQHDHILDLRTYAWHTRPLTLLTFALQRATTGADPLPFHAVNVAIHLAATVLVFFTVRRAIAAAADPIWTDAAALAAAGLFLLHPAQTEAVTYVSGRATSLMALGLLTAHLAALESLREARRWPWVVLSVFAFFMAVMAKEIAVVYPLILIAWLVGVDRFPVRRAVHAAAPQLGAFAVCVLVLAAHPGYRGLLAGLAGFALSADGLAARIQGIAGLLRVLVVPWTVNFDHDPPPVGPADVAVVSGLAVLTVLACRAIRWSRAPEAAGLLWAVCALLPTSIVLARTDPVADRLLYLPMVGVAVAVAGLMARASRSPSHRRLAATGAVIALTILGALAFDRNLQYRSEVTLWEDAVRKSPAKARARVNLGYAYELAGDLDRAEHQYRTALMLWPDLWWARKGLLEVERMREARRGEEAP